MTQQYIDECWMRRCLQLAMNGELSAHPNPMVGACIVYENRILGEGYHHAPRENYAEMNALQSVAPQDLALLPKATIYITLEPNPRHGRIPSSAELLIRHKIGRVVVGCLNPSSKVNGAGIELLQEAGINVEVGILRDECLQLIRHYVCTQVLHRPFITLKWVASTDGFLDRHRTSSEERPAELSTPQTLLFNHHLRASHQAILIGRKTFELNHPALTVRNSGGKNPLRCVLGGVGEEALNEGYQAYADIDSLLEGLRRERIQSLLVEGGAATLQSFIERDLWDEAWEEHSPVSLEEGIPAPEMPLIFKPKRELHFGSEFYHWESPVLHKHYVDF